MATVRIELQLDSSGAVTGVKNLDKGLGQAGQTGAKGFGGINSLLSGAGGMVAGMVTAGAALGLLKKGFDELKSAVVTTANIRDEITKLGVRLGISTETLSAYRLIAQRSGVTLQELSVGFRTASRNALDASNGVGDARDAFRILGISLKDEQGNLRDINDITLQVADAFAKMENGTIKTALAQDIFGRSGTNLITVLNLGSQGVSELNARAELLGITFRDEAGREAEAFNDALGDLQLSIEGFKQSVGQELIPGLTDAIDLFTDATIAARLFQEAGASVAVSGATGLAAALLAKPTEFVGPQPTDEIIARQKAAEQKRIQAEIDRIAHEKELAALAKERAKEEERIAKIIETAAIARRADNAEYLRFEALAFTAATKRLDRELDLTKQIKKEREDLNRLLEQLGDPRRAFAGAPENLPPQEPATPGSFLVGGELGVAGGVEEREAAFQALQEFRLRVEAEIYRIQAPLLGIGNIFAQSYSEIASGVRQGGAKAIIAIASVSAKLLLKYATHLAGRGITEVALGTSPPPLGPRPELVAHGTFLKVIAAVVAGLEVAGAVAGSFGGGGSSGGGGGVGFGQQTAQPQTFDVNALQSNPATQQFGQLAGVLGRLQTAPPGHVVTMGFRGEDAVSVIGSNGLDSITQGVYSEPSIGN